MLGVRSGGCASLAALVSAVISIARSIACHGSSVDSVLWVSREDDEAQDDRNATSFVAS
jgi:hypothetical protein